MRNRVVFVLGPSVWIRGADRWQRWVQRGSGHTQVDHLFDMMARIPEKNVTLVFEPLGIAHQEVECPKVSRKVFASISKVRAEYPVVVSEDIGWGMEPPEPVPGGSYSTLVHSELAVGLCPVVRAGGENGVSVPAAWSAFTVVSACLRMRAPRIEARSALILFPDFVALALVDGMKRAFRAWPQPLTERDWKALIFLASGSEQKGGSRMAEVARRTGTTAVFAEGDPEEMCPCWKELQSAARVECLLGLDALAAAASRISPRHPSNLVLGFPRPLNLNPWLSGISVAALTSSVMIGVTLLGTVRDLRVSESEAGDRASMMRSKVGALEGNRAEMEALRDEAPDAPSWAAADKASALRALADAIPDSLTLTRFAMPREDLFELEAIIVGREFDQEGTRQSLARNGFVAGAGADWTYDPAARRLSVRGKFKERAR